ncbi:MAG TPA: class I SAM-dependent methyltransferase [Noviherbaspirillum sp.]|jgi:SAM-dependent methyltransferase|uniref:class I SAM-dependent methyltransferase n=1 Tax=Noviherbaspirillum sp. TaxID=1926288 RepID=UPI002DDCA565|nr:class I SAM-dependent methyltransferase [Noviherbaspirillum sp.]HEV2610310.1 class I SAM-dependent methyltransferase [Noviherbaspirillum sp.]
MPSRQKPDLPFEQRRNALKICAVAFASGMTGMPAIAQNAKPPVLDVPYVPTPQPVVDKMLQMAKVTKKDLLYDLGCGDGRMVVTAAKKYGARGIGIDIDPKRISDAKANAKKAGVTGRTTFTVGDLFQTDLSDATVVTLYLLNSINRKLRPQLWEQLKVGTRVVSHSFDMGDEWPPEKTEVVDGSTIYYWTITDTQKKAVGK